MGELHLEIAVKFLKEYGGGLEILTSQPLVVYRETVSTEGVVAMAKSPNKHSRFWLQVEPLDQNVVDLMEKGETKIHSKFQGGLYLGFRRCFHRLQGLYGSRDPFHADSCR